MLNEQTILSRLNSIEASGEALVMEIRKMKKALGADKAPFKKRGQVVSDEVLNRISANFHKKLLKKSKR